MVATTYLDARQAVLGEFFSVNAPEISLQRLKGRKVRSAACAASGFEILAVKGPTRTKPSVATDALKVYNLWASELGVKLPGVSRGEGWQLRSLLYNLYVYRAVGAGIVHPPQLLSFAEFTNSSADEQGRGAAAEQPLRQTVAGGSGPQTQISDPNLIAEVFSTSELKTFLALVDTEVLRRRLSAQKLLQPPAHLTAAAWRQKVVELLESVTSLRAKVSVGIAKHNSEPSHQLPGAYRTFAKLQGGKPPHLARGRLSAGRARFQKVSIAAAGQLHASLQKPTKRAPAWSVFETAERLENLQFLASLSGGVEGRLSGGSLFREVGQIKEAGLRLALSLRADNTNPLNTSGGGVKGKYVQNVAYGGLRSYWPREQHPLRFVTTGRVLGPRKDGYKRTVPLDLKLLLGGLTIHLVEGGVGRTAQSDMSVPSPVNTSPTPARGNDTAPAPNPPAVLKGLEPFNRVEDSFLKVHGSVGEIFTKLNQLEHVKPVGRPVDPLGAAILDYRDYTGLFKPSEQAGREQAPVLRYERNRIGRILNSRPGNRHKITVPQQSPPEEVLQRVEQALVVHLGNNYLREVLYSHYGTWLPKYGVYAAWARSCYNPDSLTVWNSKQTETLSALIRESDWVRYFKYRDQIKNAGEQNFLKQYLFARSAYVPNDPLKKQVDLDYWQHRKLRYRAFDSYVRITPFPSREQQLSEYLYSKLWGWVVRDEWALHQQYFRDWYAAQLAQEAADIRAFGTVQNKTAVRRQLNPELQFIEEVHGCIFQKLNEPLLHNPTAWAQKRDVVAFLEKTLRQCRSKSHARIRNSISANFANEGQKFGM